MVIVGILVWTVSRTYQRANAEEMRVYNAQDNRDARNSRHHVCIVELARRTCPISGSYTGRFAESAAWNITCLNS